MANLNIRRGERGERGLARAFEPRPMMMDPFRMLQSLWSGDPFAGLMTPSAEAFAPDIEVKETKDAFQICVDLPGVRDEDVEVNVTGNQITVSGQRQEERREEGDRFFAYERSYGRFARTFTLPEGADMEHVHADLKSGVLDVEIPKRAEVQARRVPIGARAGGGEREMLAQGEPEAKGGEGPKRKAA